MNGREPNRKSGNQKTQNNQQGQQGQQSNEIIKLSTSCEPMVIVNAVLEENKNFYLDQIESETSFRRIHTLITDILDNAEVQNKDAAKFLKEYLPKAQVYIEYQKARGLIKSELADTLNSFITELIRLSEGTDVSQGQASSCRSGGNEQIDLRTAIRRFRLFLDSLAVIAKIKSKNKHK